MIKVIIVDDHLLIRVGFSTLLADYENIELIGEAKDGVEFLKLLETDIPDVVFMDINMPGMNGIDATREAIKLLPNLKIVALSTNDGEDSIDAMIQAGAKGFLLKKIIADDIIKAIENVTKGGSYFSPELVSYLSKNLSKQKSNNLFKVDLNAREKEVLNLLCQGLSTQEIADKLFLSNRTVEIYRANLLLKTNTKNSIGVVLYAIKNRLIQI